jgi:hypothetical protein
MTALLLHENADGFRVRCSSPGVPAVAVSAACLFPDLPSLLGLWALGDSPTSYDRGRREFIDLKKVP